MLKPTMEYCINLLFSITSWSKIKTVCGGIFAVLFFLLDNNRDASLIVFFLVLLDALMALVVVAKTDLKFQSSKMRHGAVKVVVYALLMVSATQFDKVLNLPNASLLPDSPIAKLVLVFLAATELLSILEHSSSIGLVIPHKLFSKIQKVRDL